MTPDRFKVKPATTGGGPHVYYVFDIRHRDYGMNENATTLYYQQEATAQTICDLMNNEWAEFQRNPS